MSIALVVVFGGLLLAGSASAVVLSNAVSVGD